MIYVGLANIFDIFPSSSNRRFRFCALEDTGFFHAPARALQYGFSPLPLLHSWLFGRLLCDALGIYWGRSGDALGTLWRRSGIRGDDDDDDDDDDDGESSISIYANSRSTALAAGRCY